MNAKLNSFFSEKRPNVPIKFEDSIIFKKENLPNISENIDTTNIIIKKGYHIYNNYYRADALRCYAIKDIYKNLGLLILSLIFHENNEGVKLNLLNSNTDVKNIIIKFHYFNKNGYIKKPHSFEYEPEEVKKFPWINDNLESWDLPGFYLTSENKFKIDEQWEKRDTVILSSTDNGMIRLAKFFLDISNPYQEIVEFDLEGDTGFKGVASGSAEIRFNLPGSIDWLE
ncbi:MAG: hypothetical protein ACFFAO_11960 [Candidatus Hermodarchaeota archaeon]